MLREPEHHSFYNPLDYNIGKLDSAREKLVSGRQGAGRRLEEGEGVGGGEMEGEGAGGNFL